MPATREAIALTDDYRTQLAALRAQTLRTTALLWQSIDLNALTSTFLAWRKATDQILEDAQRTGISAAETYLAAFVAAELRAPVAPVTRSVSGELVGRSRTGQLLDSTLKGPIVAIAVALSQGQPRPRALEMGLARAARLVSAEVLAAPRTALHRGFGQHPRITGWRRVTSSDACLACLAAATGAIRATSEILEAHTHCRCTSEAVVRGVRERYLRPTGRDLFDELTQAAQDARYGPEKAELIRSGAVELVQLATRQPMARVRDEITETPLSALRA